MADFDAVELDRMIEMAWEDRTPFEAIAYQFGVSEQEVIALMRQSLKPSSFPPVETPRLWAQNQACADQSIESISGTLP